jgi:hypothetical protein
MYDPIQVLANIDEHKTAIIAVCGLAMLCNYTWFFAAVRQSKRDRTYTIPLFCTFFWIAGDGSMVWRYDEWFNTYDHWYVKLFWIALCFTVMFEIIYVAQAIKYGREELLPTWSQAQFTAVILAGVATAVIVWSFTKHVLGDPIYIAYFHLANMAMPVMGPALLIRRKSRAGQSMLIWWAYLVMANCWYLSTYLWFGSEFRSIEYVSIWAVANVGCAVMLIALSRMPPYVPEPAASSAADDRPEPVPATV